MTQLVEDLNMAEPAASHITLEATLRHLRQIHVSTELDDLLRIHFDRLLRTKPNGELSSRPTLFANERETRGVLVTHAPGGCKTTLVGNMLRTHPALAVPHSWVEVTVPSPASLSALLRSILSNSGYPVASRKDEVLSLTEQLKRRFANLQTGVLWIDEAQDLKSVGKDNMLRTIKSFMQGPSPVIVILSGTPELLGIIQSDEQLNRRFSKLNLPLLDPFTDADKIRSAIGVYATAAGLQADLGPDLPQRVIHASRNLFGRCIENIIGAIEMALRKRDPTLNDYHFADYYQLQEGCEDHSNVFLIDDWIDITVGVWAEEK